ncbi:type 1 glutamine amidotransferase domain-containing protein [Halobacillus salinarum]|uniref:Type 1 glutamine amidotransferase domain-containing protein n=1 Tax=Halobacillus salinarum TaxID=2932257 RepID=A0ABY4EMG4_9BACI|nr:type 1 glutamine amidotransferase domain-containing protein [Halobacillus salinarum]UOQ45271.1 type 1 glutamine amidotransferase domain-containing protein [Halobacillus salinarum]
MSKKILMIVTNADQLDSGHTTGLWLQEFVEPSTEFKDAGFEITAASLNGGKIPIDPNSYSNRLPKVWDGVMEPLKDTKVLSKIQPADYDAVFLSGGHGTMVDFPNSEVLANVLQHFADNHKIIGAVCHGPAGFIGAEKSDGKPLVNGVKLTGFTNEEEAETGLTDALSFMLEDKLSEAGAEFVAGGAYQDHVEVDGNFVTGQNPQSSLSAAQAVVRLLQ